MSEKTSTRKILGESKAVKDLIAMIHKVAAAKTSILIIGESGTGKELVARMIHDVSPLKDKPFVPVNCGAIPETLIESEMFGHKKGSFTGAVSDKPGLFEVADGGTLFLDEIGELPLSMQVKMLRALQERVIRRVGGNDSIKVDVRIIAATNRDLEAAIAKGTFREDLYYRLNVIMLKTPALRERQGDIPLLANAFFERFNERQGKNLKGISPETMTALNAYGWPGNIRELENVMERAVTLEHSDQLTPAALAPQIAAAAARTKAETAAPGASAGSELRLQLPDFSKGGKADLDQTLSDVERAFISRALEHTRGVKKAAAELLGITFRSMRYRLQKLGMDDSGE